MITNTTKKISSSLMLLTIGGFFVYLEWRFFDFYLLLFTIFCTVALFFLITTLSKRPFFGLTLTFLIILTSEIISHIKFEITNFSLHAEDLYYYLFASENLKFLYEHFFIYLVYLSFILASFFTLGFLFFKFEKKSVKALPFFIAFLLTLSPIFLTKDKASDNAILFSGFYDRHLASFYLSIFEIFERNVEKNKKLIAYKKEAFKEEAKKSLDNAPHIILIHQESVIPPSLFSTLHYNKIMDDLYLSEDQKLHKMRVEIFAGTSWMTEFSIFAGLSPLDYGMKRPFVFDLTYGTLTDTITQQLKRHGYTNKHFFPMFKEFSNYDKFYGSIGMDKIYDLRDYNLTDAFQRDRVYYGEALNEMEKHFATSKAPLFSFIQTMSAHFPYGHAFEPHENPHATDPRNDKEVNEYLRRLYFVREDYKAFLQNLKQKFPDKSFVIVHYGDHHPTVTRKLVLEEDRALREKAKDTAYFQSNSVGMQSYYAVDTINFKSPKLPDYESVDASYLGDILLNSAKIPLSNISLKREQLMHHCMGRFFSCHDQEALKAFHKYVSDYGGVQARATQSQSKQ